MFEVVEPAGEAAKRDDTPGVKGGEEGFVAGHQFGRIEQDNAGTLGGGDGAGQHQQLFLAEPAAQEHVAVRCGARRRRERSWLAGGSAGGAAANEDEAEQREGYEQQQASEAMSHLKSLWEKNPSDLFQR
jgi:hypothetical protein